MAVPCCINGVSVPSTHGVTCFGHSNKDVIAVAVSIGASQSEDKATCGWVPQHDGVESKIPIIKRCTVNGREDTEELGKGGDVG